jgi:glycosyltransferase involved in cell wall biosynthesis
MGDKNDVYSNLNRPHTGMWKTEYLRKYPFNEKLKKGIDREYVEEVEKRGDYRLMIHYYAGYHYRQHGDYSCAGKINLLKDNEAEIYINAKYPTFISGVADYLEKDGYSVFLDNHPFEPQLANNAKLIWCDWGDENAYKIANYVTDAVKILRIHAYEVFTGNIHYIDFDRFDKVIFVASHILEYARKKTGKKIENAIIIPNGIKMGDFTIPLDGKEQNNKIAWAGNIDRKKGAGELMLIAEHFSEYEFHVAGKWYEQDVGEYFTKMKPDNLILNPYSYSLNNFFSDKTYYLNTSMREGCPVTPLQAMAAGLKPLIRNWYGADKYLPKYWVWKDFAELNTILTGSYDEWRYRDYVENNYNFSNMYDKIKGIVDHELNSGAVVYQGEDTYQGGIGYAGSQ